jgi:hypothetical protein
LAIRSNPPLHFDLEHHRVFVADKLVVGAEGGRLVPIPKSLSVDVEHYFRYLAKLATLLAPAEPALSAGLRGLHELNAPFLLPLFSICGPMDGNRSRRTG